MRRLEAVEGYEVDSEQEVLCDALRAAGVKGVDDFGYFANSAHFRASEFDAVGAAPILLARLPSLTEALVVSAAARHLRHVRIPADAFGTLVDAFRHWATQDFDAGWALGDALSHAARPENVTTMCALAQDRTYGRSRQMIVGALWRWRKSDEIGGTLRHLTADPDVSLHAMSALARVVSPRDLVAVLEPLTDDADANVRKQAQRQLAKARRKLGQ